MTAVVECGYNMPVITHHHTAVVANERTNPMLTILFANAGFNPYCVARIAAVIIGGMEASKMLACAVMPLN